MCVLDREMLPKVRHSLGFGAESEYCFFLLLGGFGGGSAHVEMLSWLGKAPSGFVPVLLAGSSLRAGTAAGRFQGNGRAEHC